MQVMRCRLQYWQLVELSFPLPCSGEALKEAVRCAMLKALPHASPDPAIAFLQWLGVFDPALSTTQAGSVVKTFCVLLEAKLKCVS
jgi:hypothetical protein